MRTTSFRSLLLPVLVGGAVLAPSPLAAQQAVDIDIPFEQFTLDNGLTLIVHEDRKAPIVAVNVWYHVGSKNEKPGRTGFAHLFEHLMFNGSEHYNDDYFKVLEPLGATTLNGTTNNDRTNYFQNVPTPALDVVLWMESDRMGHLLGAIDQDKLDEQRDVVKNEKRQGENQPYAKASNLRIKSTYPAAHPYSWSVIGEMEDLDAAEVEDVHEWFRTYYGAANAVVVIAGDIDAQTAKAKVEQYFGHIPSGPPVAKQDRWIAKMAGIHRETMQDRVPQARVDLIWNVPEWGSADATYLDLVTDVLARGKTSRLYKRLVYDEQIATDVAAYISMREIAGQVTVRGMARPGVDLGTVESALREEVDRLIRAGPTEDELRRVKTQYRASFVRGIEAIGGFGGKSDVLASNMVYGGRPDFYKLTLERVANATADDVQRAAERWLSDGVYIQEVHPFPQYTTMASSVDRSALPVAGPPPPARFPTFERGTLSNGLTIIVARRDAVPVVNFDLLVDAGYAADQHGTPGTASLALDMLDEGTTNRNALEISDELALLGATLGSGSNLDMSTVAMSALKENLDASLELYADVILNPAFPEADFNRLKRQRMVRIQQEKVQPIAMALRVFPSILYGNDHAYGNPLTGSGTEASLASLTREDLRRFHDSWFKANNATLVVVGATSMGEIKPKLERVFRGWRGGNPPQKNLASVPHKASSAVYILDRPGSIQSTIFAGHVAPPQANPDEIAIEAMNTILGGTFNARINMNLREDKGWSYGAQSLLWGARGQRPFIVFAPVQSDKTKESMAEIVMELNGILDASPATAAELERAKASQTLTLPGRWETNDAVAGSIAEIVRFGYDDRYFDSYADQVRALNLSEVQQAANMVLQPTKVVWVVVGDKQQIEPSIRELNLGKIYEIDADGNVMGEVKATS